MGRPSSDERERIERQFDNFCLTVLQHEKIDYYRVQSNQSKKEKVFSDLTDAEISQLCTYDEYDLDVRRYRVMGYDIEVRDSLLAEALDALTERKRDVILLSYYMDMSDAEIARKFNLLSTKTIHEHRTTSLSQLRRFLERKGGNGKKAKNNAKKGSTFVRSDSNGK